MTDQKPVPVFDGHNDVLLRLWRSGNASPETLLIEGDTVGHIDLPRAKKGGLAGGLCAAYVPSPSMDKDANGDYPTPTEADALKATLAMAGLLFRAEKQSAGALKVCRTAADIRDAMAKGAFASVFHIEGAEAIGADLDALYVLYEAGLRTLGPVWSRPNIFAYGVPFRFPSTPDIGPGLTEAGKRLIKTCNELKIMVDLSHMNEQGFWDIAKISDAPLVASHSNAYALCNHSRNLTDRQLDAIRDTGGLAGINFGVLFLREDGVKNPNTDLNEPGAPCRLHRQPYRHRSCRTRLGFRRHHHSRRHEGCSRPAIAGPGLAKRWLRRRGACQDLPRQLDPRARKTWGA